jgi:FkbM family methyltransferase
MTYPTLLKQLFIIAKSKWILHLFRGNLFSLSSFEIVTNLQRIAPNLNYIIDVGANSGQFTKVASHHYPDAKMDVFEPLPNLYPKIQKLFEGKKNITTHNLALGNEFGTIKFNKNSFGHISSILDISSENIHYPKGENSLDQIDVEIKTLDSLSLFEHARKGNSLLKLDVQGYELEVLKGGEETLKNLDYILIEANLEQLYNNQPTFTEVNTYLNNKGFELAGMLDFNLGFKNKYIEIDLLYSKVQDKN